MTMIRRLRLSASVPLLLAGVAVASLRAPTSAMPDAKALETMTARFAPTEIGTDLSKLPANDRRVLGKLVEAAKVIDALFLRQVWSGNDAMLLDLSRDQS